MTAVYDAGLARGDAPRTALRRTLKPILVAPDFLFRIETDRAPAAIHSEAEIAAARVTDVELASRLSFFLWSTLPDDELLALAEENKLSDAAVLMAQVRRMLADPRAKSLTDNFLIRWLGANRVLQARPSTEFYPTFNDGLKRAMLTEVTTFCEHLRRDDRPVLDLLAADYTFVNADLARHYGLHGLRMATRDGLEWTPPERGLEGEHLNSVVWAKDRFVAVGAGATWFSSDGAKWERVPNHDAPLNCVYGDGVFLGANWKGRLLRSVDGVAWTQVHQCQQHVEALAYGTPAA